jgi:hypothetical protein
MIQPSIETLMREIEATPAEHWSDLLTQIQQFRASVTDRATLNQDNILDTIRQIRSQQTAFLSSEEIDRQMQVERDSWDS